MQLQEGTISTLTQPKPGHPVVGPDRDCGLAFRQDLHFHVFRENDNFSPTSTSTLLLMQQIRALER